MALSQTAADVFASYARPTYQSLVVPQRAFSRKEQDKDQPTGSLRTKKQTAAEDDYLSDILARSAEVVSPVLSGIGFIGGAVDAIMGRRVRAGLALLTGQGEDKNRIGELFSIPVISDLVGWTDRDTQVTGSDLLGGWDDPDTIWDGVAEFAVETITDPLSFAPGFLFGAVNRGGRIARKAGMVPRLSKSLSNKLNRYVGPREAVARATLKDAVVMSNSGIEDLSKMPKKLRDSWDGFAKSEGYKGLDEALNDLEGNMLGGRVGVTWNPFGDARKTYGTGKNSLKYLQAVDKLGAAFAKSAPGLSLGKWFDRDVRGADTPEVQRRLKEVADALYEKEFGTRLRNAERHFAMTASGLDNPQYREAIRGMVEKQVTRDFDENEWLLPAKDRSIDAVISSNMKSAGLPDWKNPKNLPNYEAVRGYLEEVWASTEENLRHFHEKGLGQKELDSLWEQYIHRSTRPLGDPRYLKTKPPTRITRDMRRVLKEKGLKQDEIDKLSVDEAMQKAYGTKITEADKYRADMLKKAPASNISGGVEQRVAQTSDESQIRRLEFLRGIRNGGTNWVNGATMDSRLTSPMSQYADNLTMRTNIVYEEGMGGSRADLQKVDAIARKRVMAGPQKVAVASTETAHDKQITKGMIPHLKMLGLKNEDIKALSYDEALDMIPELHRGDPAILNSEPAFKRAKASVSYETIRNSATEFSPFQPGQEWGELVDVDSIPFARGKRANDLISPEEARRLNDWLTIERGALAQSVKIADWLHGLDPRHVYRQQGLFANDPALDHMNFELATGRTLLMADAALKAAADAVDSGLVSHEQGKTIITALRNAHFKGKAKQILKSLFHMNAGEFGQDAALKRAMADDYDYLFKDNPHEKYLGRADDSLPGTSVNIPTRTRDNEVNLKWVEHELRAAQARFRYGLKPSKKYARKGELRGYRAIRGKIQSALDDLEPMTDGGIHLREKDLIEIARAASAGATKLKPETLRDVINDMAYKHWIKKGNRPFRVRMDAANDLRKAMDFTKDPEVTRGFWSVWDKITNSWKGGVTSQFIGYHARNLQNLGLMDFVFGEGSEGGLLSMLNHRRMAQFAKSYNMAAKFHAGKDLKGLHKTKFFQGTDWSAMAKQLGETDSDAFRDRQATQMLRGLAMASDITPKFRTGEISGDIAGKMPEDVSEIAQMIPGSPQNIQSATEIWKDMKSQVGRTYKELRDFLLKDASGKRNRPDMSFLNPLQVRGGFFGKSNVGDGSMYGPQRLGERVGELTEDVGRTATWMRMVLGGKETPWAAAARTNAMHVDFRDLTNFEKKVAKRAIPFYTYTRKMTEYFLRDLAEHPGGRTTAMIRAINNSTGEARGENGLVPPQLAGQMAVPLYSKGKVKAYLRPDLPVEVINDMFSAGPDAYSTFQNTVLGWLGQLHTIPKAALELAFGKSTFQKGRNLEDLYSRIGTKDPILNQIVMGSPFSRYISTYGPRGTLADDRKTIGEKLANLLGGLSISTIDMEKAADEAIREAIKRELRTEEGVGRYEQFYTYDDEAVSERGKKLIELQNEIASNKRSMRKRLKADAEKNEQKAEGNMPFDKLR